MKCLGPRCENHGNLGLGKRTVHFMIGWWIYGITFCSVKCENDYSADRHKTRQEKQLRAWLHS